MPDFSRTRRAETVLSERAKAEIAKALVRRDGFRKQGLATLAQGVLDARITVVVRMPVGAFLEYSESEARGRYTAHLNVCGCRAVGVSCARGDALANEWRSARDLAGVRS